MANFDVIFRDPRRASSINWWSNKGPGLFLNIVIQESNKLKDRLFFNSKHVGWLLGAGRDEVIEDKVKAKIMKRATSYRQ